MLSGSDAGSMVSSGRLNARSFWMARTNLNHWADTLRRTGHCRLLLFCLRWWGRQRAADYQLDMVTHARGRMISRPA